VTISFLAPRKVNGRPVDIHPADPEVGGFEVCVWQNEARDDGLIVHLPDLGQVFRFLRDLQVVS
jgi:hypothetical protein